VADFTVNIEARFPGELEENAELLRVALESQAEGMDAFPTLSLAEESRGVLVALALPADDGRDAIQQGLELFDAAWDSGLGDLAPSRVLAVRAAPVRESQRLGWPQPVEDEEPAEAGA
jgi:hypothetical protein